MSASTSSQPYPRFLVRNLGRFSALMAAAVISTHAQTNVFPGDGNVGIGTTTPNYKLDVNGEINVGGAFRVGELYFSPLQTLSLAIGTERWIKLATIPNNHNVRFQLRNGSNNSEEIAEIKIFGTYFIAQTGITVERQTYNEHLREVRVTGIDGGLKTIYIKIRSSDYAPFVQWRAVDSRGAITIHNQEETPSGGLAYIVSGNLITSTNTNLNVGGSVGIGTTAPTSALVIQPNVVAGFKGQIRFSESLSDTDTIGGEEVQFWSDNLSGGYREHADIRFALDNGSSVGDSASLRFDTKTGGALSEKMRIASNGNVGIGTTNPQGLLHLFGAPNQLVMQSTGADAQIQFRNSSTNSTYIDANANNLLFFANSISTPTLTVTGGSPGNVGIGTTAPGETLDVIGRIRSTAGLAYQTADGVPWWINGIANGPAVMLQAHSAAGGPSNRRGSLGWMDNNGGKYEYLTWTDSGNVGIGTTAPQAKLDVAGNANISGNLAVGGMFAAAGYTASNGTVIGGATGLALNAGGTNQNITLAGSGSGQILVSSNLAIGAPYSSYRLAVQSGSGVTQNGLLITTTDTDQSNIFLQSNGTTAGDKNWLISTNYASAGNFEIRQSNATAGNPYTAGTTRFVIDPMGSVGIGTTNLTYGAQLTVKNAGSQQNFLTGETGDFSANSAGTQVNIGLGATSGNTYGVINTLSGGGVTWNNLVLQSGGGSVGIGTTNPGTYKLAVNGTIHAKEVIVDQTGWADDVFAPSYRNAPLSEVEQQIKEHGHLPGVPSAREVEEKGVSVAQMQATLLRKIEELTLHQIDQEKQLRQQNAELSARIERLEAENIALRNNR